MPHFTKENAVVFARRGHAALKRRKEQIAIAAHLESNGHSPEQIRLSRLWSSLAVIDERIRHDVESGNLDKAAKLAGIARTLQAQAQDLQPSNGHKKPAPIAAPPDPLV